MSTLDSLIDRIAGRSVLVVGDLMIDHFVHGRVTRISPEAPVPVVQFEREDFRLGGAANVAANIVALGGRATAVGIVGEDAQAAQLLSDLARLSIDTAGVVTDPGRCTTRKLRVVTTRKQQVARIDYESDTEVAGAVEASLVARIVELAGRADAILISDYLKGVVSGKVARACIDEATRRGLPGTRRPEGAAHRLLRRRDGDHPEPSRGGGGHAPADQDRRGSERGGEEGARALRLPQRLVTRGEHGMWLLAPEGETELPAEAREVPTSPVPETP